MCVVLVPIFTQCLCKLQQYLQILSARAHKNDAAGAARGRVYTHTHRHVHICIRLYVCVLLCSATDACLSKSACRYAWLAIWCDPRPTATSPPPSAPSLSFYLLFISNHPPAILCSALPISLRAFLLCTVQARKVCALEKIKFLSLFFSFNLFPLSLIISLN